MSEEGFRMVLCFCFEIFGGGAYYFFFAGAYFFFRALSIKIARYVICDDAIIAVRINTNDNDINNNLR
jgi:hypothetical protein